MFLYISWVWFVCTRLNVKQWAQKMKYGHCPCSDVITLQPKMTIWKKNWTCNMYYLIEIHVINCTRYSATNERTMNDKVESMTMEGIVACYSLLSQHYMWGFWKIMQPFSTRSGHRAQNEHWPWKIKCTWDKHHNDKYYVIIIGLGYWITLLKLQKFIDMTDG
jgi:hypothetical protein